MNDYLFYLQLFLANLKKASNLNLIKQAGIAQW